MQAFQNDSQIKERYIQRVYAHRIADEIVQGYYWQNGKGCAVGCTIHGNEHDRYETELGIPRQLAYLQDRIFEGLSNEEAKDFPLAFLEAISVGADLSRVLPHFIVWLLADEHDGVIRFVKSDQGKTANAAVVALYKRLIAGESVPDEDWQKARHLAAYAAAAAADAYDAYAAAAYAAAAYAYAAYAAAAYADAYVAYAYGDADADAYAAYAAAAYADAYAADADAAAYADAYAADADADAADADADADAARKAHYRKMRDKLVGLLKEAPVAMVA